MVTAEIPYTPRPRRFPVTTALSATLLVASVLGWATSYIPITSVQKSIHRRTSSVILASDSGIASLMLYDTSNGWRNAVMAWDVAVPYWLLTLGFGALPAWRCYRRVRQKSDENLCPRCGYDQRGTIMAGRGVCPECGAVVRAINGNVQVRES